MALFWKRPTHTTDKRQRIVILGGGFAGVYTALRLDREGPVIRVLDPARRRSDHGLDGIVERPRSRATGSGADESSP